MVIKLVAIDRKWAEGTAARHATEARSTAEKIRPPDAMPGEGAATPKIWDGVARLMRHRHESGAVNTVEIVGSGMRCGL